LDDPFGPWRVVETAIGAARRRRGTGGIGGEEAVGAEQVGEGRAAEAAAGHEMTVDAALVTLDFLLRWQLLPAATARAVEAHLENRVAGADGGRSAAA